MSNPITRMRESAFEQLVPISAQLELTYKCNLLCSFCYNSPQKRETLTGEQWLVALDRLKAAGSFTITLSGGEPFRHKDFWKIAEGVRERGLVLKTYTNAVDLARREWAERYAALGPFDTEVSIHGPDAATHERLTGVRGSYDKLLTALGHLSELGIKVTLKTPITRINQAKLAEIEAVGASFGYNVTFDTNIVPTDDGDQGPLGMAADRKFLVQFFARQMAEGTRGISPRPVEKMSAVCSVGRSGVTLDPYGDIFPCVAWRRPLGNILKIDNLLDLWQGKGGLNKDLEYVRRVAAEAGKRTLAGHPEGAFATFCPATAEKETGDAFAFYPAARASGLAKLEAAKVAEARGEESAGNPAESEN